MEEWRVAPSFAMAANRGPLASRVARLLGLPEKGASLRNAGAAFGILCLAAALIAGNALFGLVHNASARSLRSLQTVITARAATAYPVAAPAPRPVPSLAAAQPAAASKIIDLSKADWRFAHPKPDLLLAINPEAAMHQIRALLAAATTDPAATTLWRAVLSQANARFPLAVW